MLHFIFVKRNTRIPIRIIKNTYELEQIYPGTQKEEERNSNGLLASTKLKN